MRDRHGSRCQHWRLHCSVAIKRKRNQPGMFGIALSIPRDHDAQKLSNSGSESSHAAETCGMP